MARKKIGAHSSCFSPPRPTPSDPTFNERTNSKSGCDLMDALKFGKMFVQTRAPSDSKGDRVSGTRSNGSKSTVVAQQTGILTFEPTHSQISLSYLISEIK